MHITHHRPLRPSVRDRLDKITTEQHDEMTVWEPEDDLDPARGLSIAFLASMLFWATCAFGLAVAGVRVLQGL